MIIIISYTATVRRTEIQTLYVVSVKVWPRKPLSKHAVSAWNFKSLNHSTTDSTSVTRWSLPKTNLIANGHKIVNLPSDRYAGVCLPVADLGLAGRAWSGRSTRKQSVSGRAAADTCGTTGTDGLSLGGFAIRDCDYFPGALAATARRLGGNRSTCCRHRHSD